MINTVLCDYLSLGGLEMKVVSFSHVQQVIDGEMLGSAHSKPWMCVWVVGELVSPGCWDRHSGEEQSQLSHTCLEGWDQLSQVEGPVIL